jgi:hypothetical protein
LPERCRADWSDIVDVGRMVDRAGFDFILPIARWKGYGSEMDVSARERAGLKSSPAESVSSRSGHSSLTGWYRCSSGRAASLIAARCRAGA